MSVGTPNFVGERLKEAREARLSKRTLRGGAGRVANWVGADNTHITIVDACGTRL